MYVKLPSAAPRLFTGVVSALCHAAAYDAPDESPISNVVAVEVK